MTDAVIYRLGWALVHFLWQGATVAVVLLLALTLLRRRSANARYLAASVALIALALMPMATFALIEAPAPPSDAGPVVAMAPAGHQPAPTPESAAKPGAPPPAVSITPVPAEPPAVTPADAPAHAELPRSIPVQSPVEEGPIAKPQVAPAVAADAWIDGVLPWLVAGWLAGVALLAVRLLAGWLWLQRFTGRHAVPVTDDRFLTLLTDLARRLGLRQPIRLLESALTQVPLVVGWLRPAVLLPVSAVTGLSVREWEAILAHELAHIRRHDYLVNLVQSVVETLLFYHPAVWWVSHRMRVERENCCDDMAVSLCGDRLTFAHALTQLEELRQPAPVAAVAATGGVLLSRIRRLFGLAEVPQHRSVGWLAGMVVLGGLVFGAIGLAVLSRPEPSEASNMVEVNVVAQDQHKEVSDLQPKEEQPADPAEKQLADLVNQADRIVVAAPSPDLGLTTTKTLKGPHQPDQALPKTYTFAGVEASKPGQKWVLFLKADEHTQNWATLGPLPDKDWFRPYSEVLVKKIDKELTKGITWSEPVKGLALGIKLRPMATANYLPGQPIFLDIALRNTGDKAIKIEDLRYNIYDYWPNLRFDVTDPDGKVWELAKPEGPIKEADRPNPRTLAPGASYIHSVQLTQWPTDPEKNPWLRPKAMFFEPGPYKIRAIYENKHQAPDVNWTGKLLSPQVGLTVKENKTQRALATIKDNPTKFAFRLTYHGKPLIKDQRETRSLFLFAYPIGDIEFNVRVVESHEFPPEQMIQLAEFLAKDGFFERAKSATFEEMNPENFEGYTWTIADMNHKGVWHEKLGMNAAVLKKLAALRGALKGKAATEMDGVLKEWAQAPAPAAGPGVEVVEGVILEVQHHNKLPSILVEGKIGNFVDKIVFHLDEKTKISFAGTPPMKATPNDLKVGQRVRVTWNGGVAKSDPPQAMADVITIQPAVPANGNVFFGTIKEVRNQNKLPSILVEGKVGLINDTIVFHLNDKSQVAFAGKSPNKATPADLKVGQQVMVQYDAEMALTDPPQTTATAILIQPAVPANASVVKGIIRQVTLNDGKGSILVEEAPTVSIGKIVFHLTKDTQTLHANNTPAKASNLKVGQRVSVQFSSGVDDSEPPQAAADKITIEAEASVQPAPKPGEKSKQAVDAIKANPKAYYLWVKYSGPESITKRSLMLFGGPPGKLLYAARVVPNLPMEQMHQLVDFLAADGFFERASLIPLQEVHDKSAPGYTWIFAGKTQKLVWFDPLGLTPAALKKLDALRAELKGQAAKEMDELLKEWDTLRDKWANGPVPPANPFIVKGIVREVTINDASGTILVEETPKASFGKIIFHLTKGTEIVHADKTPATAADLKIGQKVSVHFSGDVAESKPPQAGADKIVIEAAAPAQPPNKEEQHKQKIEQMTQAVKDKANTFALFVRFHDPAGDKGYPMISAAFWGYEPELDFKFNGPLVTGLSKAQVGKIVDELRKQGFFAQSVDAVDKTKPPEGPGYTLELYNGAKMSRWEWIGFDLTMIHRLDGLRDAMDGKAADAMKQVLKKLEKARKSWEAAQPKPAPPPLKVEIELDKTVQEIEQPHGLTITYTNTSAKPVYVKVYPMQKINVSQQAEHIFIGQGKFSDGWVFNVGGVFGGQKKLEPGEKWTRPIGDIGFWLNPLAVESIGPLEKPFKQTGAWHIQMESFEYSEDPEFKSFRTVSSNKVTLHLRGSLATVGIAPKLKENWKNFRLELAFWGKGGDDKLSLLLTGGDAPAQPGLLVAQLDEKQVAKFVDQLEKAGFLERVKNVAGKSVGYNAPTYVLTLSAGKVLGEHAEPLGWGPALFAHLQDLRAALDGEAAQKLDQLTKKLTATP